MACINASIEDGVQFMAGFRRRAIENRLPVNGAIAITHRCNLRCKMCYVNGGPDHRDLDTDFWLRTIDAIADAGCLYLLFTGGEPLLRSDFNQLYKHARQRGILVTVFTNGTLLTESHLELFREFPPLTVEVSLYGASPETYSAITGSGAAFEMTRANIIRLQESGCDVRLKTMLMQSTQADLAAMEAFAAELGLSFRFDPAIFSPLEGDSSPCDERVNAEDAARLEFEDPRRATEWKSFYDRFNKFMDPDKLFTCGAGISTFHVDAAGSLQPCLAVDGVRYNLVDGSFPEGWQVISDMMAELTMPEASPCRGCEARLVCGYCAATVSLETGRPDRPNPYSCELGMARLKQIKTGPGE